MNAPLTFGLLRKNRKLYANLRVHASGIIMDLMLKDERTIAQAAERRGLKISTYCKLRTFVRDHRDAVGTGLRTGNWRPVEEILFPELFAAYPHRPTYKAAHKTATAELRRMSRRQRKEAQQTPPPSWLRRLFGKLGRWLG